MTEIEQINANLNDAKQAYAIARDAEDRAWKAAQEAATTPDFYRLHQVALDAVISRNEAYNHLNDCYGARWDYDAMQESLELVDYGDYNDMESPEEAQREDLYTLNCVDVQ